MRGTALSLCVFFLAATACLALINVGANPDGNPEVTEYPTPLHVAVGKGAVDVTETLLALGADTEARNSEDFTPLMIEA